MSETYILEMRKMQKKFPGVKALEQVTLQIRTAEIHGLVGENGAGKSTLMKILAGIYSPDEGEIIFCGQKQQSLTVRAVEKLGIHFIHQERQVVAHLTVAESLFLGIEPTFSLFKLLNRKSLEKEAETVIQKTIGYFIQGNKLMADLTVGEQQLLQICRALLHEPKVIVFDEPTAVLAKREADRLFEIIRELGKTISIIYISHYFGEILDLCDRITVLRNGTKVKTLSTQGLKIEDIVFMMSGRSIDEQFPEKNRKQGEVLLEVRNITDEGHFRNVSLTVRSGEIVGLTGLMGSGYNQVGTAIYGHTPITGGSIVFAGKALKSHTIEEAVALGIGYVPEDRRSLGVVQNMSVQENISLASLKALSRYGVIKLGDEQSKAEGLIDKLAIKTPGADAIAGFLSGGNQQKVVLAKWISRGANLYILNQPTAGVDVGAKAEIYALLHQMTKKGVGILLISQDIAELAGLSDRILVMYRGEIVHELDGNTHTGDDVVVAMMGGDQNEFDNRSA